jgi:hypothetical protein
MTLSTGPAEAAQQGAAAAAGSGDDDGRSEIVHGGEESDESHDHGRPADSVNVHVSDGELNPSPVARRDESRTRSSSSSSDVSDDGQRSGKIASVVVKGGGVRAAVAAMEASRGTTGLAETRRQRDVRGSDDGHHRGIQIRIIDMVNPRLMLGIVIDGWWCAETPRVTRQPSGNGVATEASRDGIAQRW